MGVGRAAAFLACLSLAMPASSAADPIGWPQPGGDGSIVRLTYSYANLFDGGFNTTLTTPEMRLATQEAMRIWARYAPLEFVEVRDQGPPPSEVEYDHAHVDIRIGYNQTLSDGGAAHAHLPFERPRSSGGGLAGDVHFSNDVSIYRTNVWGRALDGPLALDFFSAILHELGHSLGLVHIVDQPAVMGTVFRVFMTIDEADLLPADIAAIRALYGSGVGSVTPLDPQALPTPEPMSLILVASGAGVLYRRRRFGSWGRAPRSLAYGFRAVRTAPASSEPADLAAREIAIRLDRR